MTMEPRRLSFSTVLRWTDRQCRTYLEKVRWPDGPVCPKCGALDPYFITRKTKSKNRVPSLYKCRSCRRQFTVTVGTVFGGSKIPLGKWFAAIYPMCTFKRGIGAQQVHIQTKVTYKSAWFMCHRIREAMREKDYSPLEEAVVSMAQKKRPHKDTRIKLNLSFGQALAWLAPKHGSCQAEESGNCVEDAPESDSQETPAFVTAWVGSLQVRLDESRKK